MARRNLSRRRLRQLITAIIGIAVATTGIMAIPDQPIIVPNAADQAGLEVVRVSDGDTIVIRLNGREETVRMIGVDTPETRDPRKPVQCFGREASDWTKQQLSGRRVTLEPDPTQGERDRYNRLLGYIRRDDGLFINQALIQEGYAHEYTYQSQPYKYQIEFQKQEAEARNQSRGLWNPSACNGDTTQTAN